MTDELKPCPFCESDKVETYRDWMTCLHYVHCLGDSCRAESGQFFQVNLAIKAWNRRAVAE